MTGNEQPTNTVARFRIADWPGMVDRVAVPGGHLGRERWAWRRLIVHVAPPGGPSRTIAMPNYGGYVVATIGGFDDEERDVPVGWCPTLDQAERIAAELDRQWTSHRLLPAARKAQKSCKSRATKAAKAASKPRPDLIGAALDDARTRGGHIVQGVRDVIGVRAASVGFAGATEPLADPAPWDRAIERADAGSDGSLDSILRAWFRRDYPSLPMPYSVRGEDQPKPPSVRKARDTDAAIQSRWGGLPELADLNALRAAATARKSHSFETRFMSIGRWYRVLHGRTDQEFDEQAAAFQREWDERRARWRTEYGIELPTTVDQWERLLSRVGLSPQETSDVLGGIPDTDLVINHVEGYLDRVRVDSGIAKHESPDDLRTSKPPSEHRSLSRSDRQAMRDALVYGTGLGDLIRWHGTLTNAPTVQLSDRVAWIADHIGLIRQAIGTVPLSELPKRHFQTTDPEAGKRLQVCRELLYLLAQVNLSDDAGIPEPLIERAEQLANGLRQYVGAIGAGGGGSQNVPTGGAGDDDQRRAVDPATPASVPLTSDHELILSTLAKAQMKCKQVHWVVSNGTIRNRETVGRLLRELKVRGLVDHPYGKRKGYVLTEAGRLRLPGASPT